MSAPIGSPAGSLKVTRGVPPAAVERAAPVSAATVAADFLRLVLAPLRDREVYRTEIFPRPAVPANNWVSVEKMADHLVRYGQDANAYFAMATFPSAAGGAGDRKAEHAVRIGALWADLDCGEGKPYATQEEALARLRSFPLRPHAVIDSGRGIHAHWGLTQPVAGEDLDRAISLVRGLAYVLDADRAVADRARIMRIPGTMNIDSVAHKKDGKDYAVSTIYLDTDANASRYTLDDFVDAGVPEVSKGMRDREAAGVAADGEQISEGMRRSTLLSIAGTMRSRGMTELAIAAALRAENEARCDPPLPDDEVDGIIASAGEWERGPLRVEAGASVAGRSAGPNPWPEPPGDAAFSGFLGEFVRQVDPHTEADPVAVALQLLAAFGAAIGSGPHFMVGATRHAVRENVLIVGRTSKARKGDSFEPVKAVFAIAAPEFMGNRLISGLSTGEGLIHSVRDPNSKTSPIREKGVIVRYEDEIVDQGIDDKRLLVVEPEFARVLRVAGRDGNTLSAVIRQAWDCGTTPLRVVTRSNAEQATGAHISIVGHITTDELQRELSGTEAANGFANRYLFAVVKRSKLLPEPEPFRGGKVDALGQRLRQILDFTGTVGEMRRDADASLLWREIYPSLSSERTGLTAALTARAEAHVLRLSMMYALLDRSAMIRVEHIVAAAEMWGYCERSAQYIFGTDSGNPTAARILAALSRGPLDRTQITRELFANHLTAAKLDVALEYLTANSLAKSTRESTGGRVREIWAAV